MFEIIRLNGKNASKFDRKFLKIVLFQAFCGNIDESINLIRNKKGDTPMMILVRRGNTKHLDNFAFKKKNISKEYEKNFIRKYNVAKENINKLKFDLEVSFLQFIYIFVVSIRLLTNSDFDYIEIKLNLIYMSFLL